MRLFILNLLKFALIGIIPFLILCISYVVLDPFKVINHYDCFIDPNSRAWIDLNKDHVSTQTFINNSNGIHYNSFIFGNSRSIFYQVSDWKKHLPENSNCFHFDASDESLWAIEKKVEFIDKSNLKLENVLLILDNEIIKKVQPKKGHLFVTSPSLVNNSNLIDFHKSHLLAFLSIKFLFAYLDFNISGNVKQYMRNAHILDDRPRNYDVSTNEFRFDYYEELIQKNNFYTTERMSVFFERDTVQQYSNQNIFEEQEKLFRNIYSVLTQHGSNVKIIISPLYDQIKFNESDLSFLKDLFGDENIFDFSGINQFTNDYTNYYESSHYRPHVASQILDIVYNRNR